MMHFPFVECDFEHLGATPTWLDVRAIVPELRDRLRHQILPAKFSRHLACVEIKLSVPLCLVLFQRRPRFRWIGKVRDPRFVPFSRARLIIHWHIWRFLFHRHIFIFWYVHVLWIGRLFFRLSCNRFFRLAATLHRLAKQLRRFVPEGHVRMKLLTRIREIAFFAIDAVEPGPVVALVPQIRGSQPWLFNALFQVRTIGFRIVGKRCRSFPGRIRLNPSPSFPCQVCRGP